MTGANAAELCSERRARLDCASSCGRSRAKRSAAVRINERVKLRTGKAGRCQAAAGSGVADVRQ